MYGQTCGSICVIQQKTKQSKNGLSRIRSSIMPEDYVVSSSLNQTMKNLNTMKNARRKLEIPMPAAMFCKTPVNGRGETCHNIWKRKTRYACVVDADESTRPRVEGAVHKSHQDHITEKGMNSLNHYNLVHKFIPMLQATKDSGCKDSSGKIIGKLEKVPAWKLTKVRNKKEVIEEARNKGRKVHFASSMDLCHLKNSELEPPYQKYKGRVVLRGDIVRDDSRLYAVFTEQGSFASYMIAAKVMDIISKDCQLAQDKRQMQYPRSKWKMHRRHWKFQSQNVLIFGYVYHDTSGHSHGPVWKTQSFLLNGICAVIFWQDCCGNGNLRKFYQNISYLWVWTISNFLERNRTSVRLGIY